METYYEDLYDNIFYRLGFKAVTLRVISGYASSGFLSRVLEDFPDLKIELFLGMTIQGVSSKNHLEFKSLMSKNKELNVYYQIDGAPNHMKILEFQNLIEKKTYVGSANFSENGFSNHKELMTEIPSLPGQLFDEQYENSLLCTDENIGIYINFYEEDALESVGSSKVIKGTETDDELEPTVEYEGEKKKTAERAWGILRERTDYQYHSSFSITVVLPKENNARWSDKGVNAWVSGKTPVIEQTNKILFPNVFPQEEEFDIYTDDGYVMKARLKGNFKGQLEVLNFNLYDYIQKRSGITEKRPISYDDLKAVGCTTMYFRRVNFNEFIMSFDKINM